MSVEDEKQRRTDKERGSESDDNYPLDSCPALVVNQLAPVGKGAAYHWLQ